MSTIKIIADSTCDLSDELLNKYHISILPLLISMEDKSYKDREEINPLDIFEWSDKTGKTPKTSAPTLGEAIEFLQPFVDEKMDIIFFGISEAMSSTCQVVRLAAENMGCSGIYVIDSKNLSTGIGLQILRAAEMAIQNKTVNEILEEMNRITNKVKASFVIDTLTFLYRGGRCSAVTALLANTLKLKPKIVVTDGKMDVEKKYRGKQSAVIMKYAKDLEDDLRRADPARVFITHAECPKEIVDQVYEYLVNLNIFKEILITKAGSVISTHSGPKTLGILYINK